MNKNIENLKKNFEILEDDDGNAVLVAPKNASSEELYELSDRLVEFFSNGTINELVVPIKDSKDKFKGFHSGGTLKVENRIFKWDL